MAEERILLLVDDEANIIQSLKRLLRKEPYRLLTAANGGEALEILASECPQVIVSDQRMPGMTGVEFFQKTKTIHPSSVRVILSGFAEIGAIVDAVNKGEIFRFLVKPWNDDELKMSIRHCFEHYDILTENQRLLAKVSAQNEELNRLNDTLEDLVAERTRGLRLEQNILYTLPMAVLGIDGNGEVVMTNHCAGAKFPRLDNAVGESITDLLPPAGMKLVEAVLGGGALAEPLVFEWDSAKVSMRATPLLGDEGELRGCVLVLD